MAEYQRVEYRIGRDGTITETVIQASGDRCTLTTAAIEQALGTVDQRQLLPDYYEGEEPVTSESTQRLNQN